jgi:glycosyltransferase involved in cell wall biosynthesis
MKADNILTIGCAYKVPKGGIAACEHAYSTFYKPFNHIATVAGGNKWEKIMIVVLAWMKFLLLITTKHIDLVHVHGASYASFWRKAPFILVSKALGKKVVYHVHGGGFIQFTTEHRRSVQYVVNHCDVIVALSDVFKTFFEDDLHAKKVVIIPNPVENALENHSVRQQGICNFLFLGLVCKSKGIFDLIEVVNEKQNELRGRAKFVIGGIGELDKLKNLIKKYGIEDLVESIGWVAGAIKVQKLNEADVFVLPSYIEGLPICILEAETYHLPIISTNVGGIPEIVRPGQNGYLITPGNKEELSAAIIEMVTDSGLREKWGGEILQVC